MFRDILEGHGVDEVDLLHVNCEGCEWEMLENIIQAGEHSHVR